MPKPLDPKEILGPVPKDKDPQEYDKIRRRLLWTMPSGLYVLGSRFQDQRNFMTINWAGQICSSPKLIYVSVEADSLTNVLIEQSRCFTLCFIDKKDRSSIRKFVKPCVFDPVANTLCGHSFIDTSSGVPVLEIAFGYLQCRVDSMTQLGSHNLFVGEVFDVEFWDEEKQPLMIQDTNMSYGG